MIALGQDRARRRGIGDTDAVGLRLAHVPVAAQIHQGRCVSGHRRRHQLVRVVGRVEQAADPVLAPYFLRRHGDLLPEACPGIFHPGSDGCGSEQTEDSGARRVESGAPVTRSDQQAQPVQQHAELTPGVDDHAGAEVGEHLTPARVNSC